MVSKQKRFFPDLRQIPGASSLFWIALSGFLLLYINFENTYPAADPETFIKQLLVISLFISGVAAVILMFLYRKYFKTHPEHYRLKPWLFFGGILCFFTPSIGIVMIVNQAFSTIQAPEEFIIEDKIFPQEPDDGGSEIASSVLESPYRLKIIPEKSGMGPMIIPVDKSFFLLTKEKKTILVTWKNGALFGTYITGLDLP